MTGSKKYKKYYKGGQARWPAPFNPAPPHAIPSVECRFPNFRPLVLSQFGGTRKYKKRKSRTRKTKKSRTRKYKK